MAAFLERVGGDSPIYVKTMFPRYIIWNQKKEVHKFAACSECVRRDLPIYVNTMSATWLSYIVWGGEKGGTRISGLSRACSRRLANICQYNVCKLFHKEKKKKSARISGLFRVSSQRLTNICQHNVCNVAVTHRMGKQKGGTRNCGLSRACSWRIACCVWSSQVWAEAEPCWTAVAFCMGKKKRWYTN